MSKLHSSFLTILKIVIDFSDLTDNDLCDTKCTVVQLVTTYSTNIDIKEKIYYVCIAKPWH
jgi:hypothetical protein